MIKNRWFSFLAYKSITFGDFTAHQFVLFECKYLCTILFFYFRGDGWQDRWHTHAFNAVSVKFFGSYLENVVHKIMSRAMFNTLHLETETKIRSEIFRFFPRDQFHKLGHSDGCLTMLVSGPWKKTWKEIRKDGDRLYTVELNWSRHNTKELT